MDLRQWACLVSILAPVYRPAVGLDHQIPFVCRFIRNGVVWGPRPLSTLAQQYAGSPDHECAPAAADGITPAGEWRSINGWARELEWIPPPVATQRQLARLVKLGVPHAPATITAREALDAIAAAEASLPATKGRLASAKELGISVPSAATRAQVDAFIAELEDKECDAEDVAEAAELVHRLRAEGLPVPLGLSLGDAYGFEDAWENLQGELEAARKIGFRPEWPRPLTPTALGEMMLHLMELVEVVDRATGCEFDTLEHNGAIPRTPSAAAVERVLPLLFERIQRGEWRDEESDFVWLATCALISLPSSRKKQASSGPSPATASGVGPWPVVALLVAALLLWAVLSA